jgi:hypothetical protein
MRDGGVRNGGKGHELRELCVKAQRAVRRNRRAGPHGGSEYPAASWLGNRGALQREMVTVVVCSEMVRGPERSGKAPPGQFFCLALVVTPMRGKSKTSLPLVRLPAEMTRPQSIRRVTEIQSSSGVDFPWPDPAATRLHEGRKCLSVPTSQRDCGCCI